MTSQEKALLVLKTSDLTFNQSNSVGTANATGTQCTWNNINLRVLLGNLYDKYSRFNLCLNTFTTGPCGTLADAETGTYLTLSGLPFVNNTYGVKTNSINTEAFLGSVLWKPQSTIAASTTSTSTSFVGSIALYVLTVNSFGYSGMLSVTGTTTGNSATLTLSVQPYTPLPVGSVITGPGVSGYVTIIAQTSATTYTISSLQTIPASTLLTVAIPNNVCLPTGAIISGNGITAGTKITGQTGAYTYTVDVSHAISTIPMTATVSNTIAASTTTYCTDIKYYENSRITFTKNQDVCNLTLNIRKTSNDALPASTFPNMILVFDIVGCDEYRVDDVTQARILK
jgi:hypothetical protein